MMSFQYAVRISGMGILLKSFIFDLFRANQPNWASSLVMILKLSDNMPMKSKRPLPLSREARWRNKVKTWPNMSSRMADSSSGSTSSEEKSEGPSREASEAPDVHPKTLQEGDVKPSQEELSEALNAGNRVPPEEDSTTLVLNSKIGEDEACLSSDSAGKTAYYPIQGELHDGPVVSATSSGDTNHTGNEKRPQRRSFDCTVCGKKLYSVWEVQEHPDLGVGICRACYSFLFSSPYTKDKIDCSEEQCRWCGQGGRIVMCDECDKSFCDSCIVRNYGPKTLAHIVSSNWSCFCCNPELLRVPIDELKEFQNTALQLTETNEVACKRKSASRAEQLISRDASEDGILGTEAGGATIAELLDQEEEQRKKHNGMWTNSRRVKSTAHIAGRKNKKATSSLNPAVHPKVRHAATTEVKQEPWVAIDQQAPASATTGAKQNHCVATDQQSPASATAEGKQKQEEVVDKQAPAPVTPATRTWIRPHQWEQKRKEAAERRKRAAEAELLKNVSDDGPKHGTNSIKSEDLQHNVRCKEEDACLKMPTKIAHDRSDAIIGNADKGKKSFNPNQVVT